MTTAAMSQPVIIDMNLLPVVHRPAQVTWQQIAIAAVLVLALFAMVPLAFRLDAARTDAAEATRLATQAEVELSGLEAELSQQRALRVETDQAVASAAVLTAKRELFQGGVRPLSDDLFWLNGYNFLPPGARITTVTATQDGFLVDAVATGPLDGIAYATNLVESGRFPAARMTSFTPGDKTGGQFTVEVTR